MKINHPIGKRKLQHIDICQDRDVEARKRQTGFESFEFIPNALPETNVSDLQLERTFLGREFSAPLLITGMTGGVEKGEQINRTLANVAAAFAIPMGVGSQRMALEDPDYATIFQLKKNVPNLFLIGNIGFAQLLRDDYLDICRQAVEMIAADALAIHLNVLQECVQKEGDRSFAGIGERIAAVCDHLSVPVLAKEVGSGLSVSTAETLITAGVSALDVGGRGGTSWPYIEGLRGGSRQQQLGNVFRDWGIPTAFAVQAIRKKHSDIPLVATGGIRDGLMVAKAVALGADMVGVGLPLLRAALESEDQAMATMNILIEGLKIAMMGTGSRSLADLKTHLCMGLPYAQPNFS